MDGWMEGRIRSMNRKDRWMEGKMDGWMEGRMDGWKDGRKDRKDE